MSTKPSFVTSVLWQTPDFDIAGSRTSFGNLGSASGIYGDELRSPTGIDVRGTPTIPSVTRPPLVSDRPDSYRITGTHVGNDEEQNRIREDERRQADRELERRNSWNWATTGWNVAACLLCPACFYCMFGALLCNIFAYVDHKSRDYERERRKLRCALWWSIASFIVGVIAVIVVLIVLFAVFDAQDWNSVPAVPGKDFTM